MTCWTIASSKIIVSAGLADPIIALFIKNAGSSAIGKVLFVLVSSKPLSQLGNMHIADKNRMVYKVIFFILLFLIFQ